MYRIRRTLGFGAVLLLGLLIDVQAQTPAALRSAQIQVAEGNYAAAAAGLEAIGLAGLTPQGAHLLGRSYQAMLRHEQAVAVLAHADTSQASVLVDWGSSLERLGLSEEAEVRYRAAYQQDSTNQQIAATLARLLGERNAWDEVAAIYERLLEEDHLNSYLHAQLGTAYTKLDSTDLAIIHYERSLALNPRNVKVVLALTKVYYNIEYIESAERVLARALDERPRHAALWRRSGEFALKKQAYHDAVEAFSKVLRYTPDSTAKDLNNLGVSSYLTSAYEDALRLLQYAFDLDDQEALNAFYLGMTYHQLEQYEEALRYLNHAADLLSEGMLADVYARIGLTHEQLDQQLEAIRTYRLALNLDAGRTEVLFHLAALYDAYYADKNMAADQYERFLERVDEDQLPQMQRYAQQRLQEIRENAFFEQGRAAEPVSLDTLVIQPADSSDTRDQ